MSQCVPSWDVDENPPPLPRSLSLRSSSNSTANLDVPMSVHSPIFNSFFFFVKQVYRICLERDMFGLTLSLTELQSNDVILENLHFNY
jgi:hypothetical protein